ncbi:MAG: Y-family DNA polymerase [Armatimonadota bacterium]
MRTGWILCVQAHGIHLAAAEADSTQPAVVLSDSRVLEANSLAINAGVSSGMRDSGLEAVCPQALCYAHNPDASLAMRRNWLDSIADVALALEPLDDKYALMDMRGLSAKTAATELLERAKKLNLEVSTGIAPGRTSAQLALRALKGRPGAFRLPYPLRDALAGLELSLVPSPLDKIAVKAQRLGWKSFGALAVQNMQRVRSLLGMEGLALWGLAQGCDDGMVKSLYPEPKLEYIGDFPENITEQTAANVWAKQARQMERALEGRGAVWMQMSIWNEGASMVDRMTLNLNPPASQQPQIMTALMRMWDKRFRHPEPLRWELLITHTQQVIGRQMSFEEAQTHHINRQVERTFSDLRSRYGERALVTLSEIKLDWHEQMRRYYEPFNMEAYQCAAECAGAAASGAGARLQLPVEPVAGAVEGGGQVVGGGAPEELLSFCGRRGHTAGVVQQQLRR